MNFVNFLNNNSLKPVRESGEEFIEFIDKTFEKYINTLNKLEYCEDEWKCLTGKEFCNENIKKINDFINSINVDKIKNTCEQMVNALKIYCDGSFEKAYKIIRSLIEANYEYLDFMDFNTIKGGLYSSSKVETTIFYKIRAVEKDKKLSLREELFHVPFDKKDKKQGRYNAADYPCIYMGNSIKVCWNECERPDHFYLVAIDIRELGNNDFLIFRDESSQLAKELGKNTLSEKGTIEGFLKFFEKFLYSFPILSACSINVTKHNKDFKPEYILPNILTECIREKNNKFAGIIYFSCKNRNDNYGYREDINIVITTIPNENSKEKYSIELGKKIMLSEIKECNVNSKEDIEKLIKEFKAQDFRKLF